MEQKSLRACAIIVAGGIGSRAIGSDKRPDLPKQLQILGSKPVILWSLEAFANDARFTQIIIVCADSLRDQIADLAKNFKVTFATGGQTRTASVRGGLLAIDKAEIDFVFVHDAARPGLDQDVLDRLFEALMQGADGAAPALQVADALWHVEQTSITAPQGRSGLMRVQTPQAFKTSKLLAAYEAIVKDAERPDDVAVAIEVGLKIVVVEGSAALDKITWPQDFARMEHALAPPLLPRVGSGFDAHKFSEGEHVTLCGVRIAHIAGLAGYSDADVAWHALADALYGALSAGDIGHHFPPSDARWKGAASSVFLKHAGDMVVASGGRINHLDVTLICEAPKVGPHRSAMIEATAALLGLRPDQVSVKATTTEAMGFTGRREGIAAHASATILLPETFRKAVEVPV